VSQQDDLDRTNRSWALGRASLGAGEGSIRSRSREVKLGRAADVVEGPRPRHQVRSDGSVMHLLRHGWLRPVCSRTLSPSTAVASVCFLRYLLAKLENHI